MEEMVVRRQDGGGLVTPGSDEHGALQRALLTQWQVAGYLMAVLGLTLGAYLVDVGAGPWMFAVIYAAVQCVVLVAPMIGAAVAMRMRRYRLAAISSLLGAGGYAFSALCCLLMAPLLGDWPSTDQMLTSITVCLLLVPPLLVASRAALEAGRALWHVPSNPRQLGPGEDLQPMPRISAGDTAPDRSAHEPTRLVRPIRYAYR